MMLSIFLSLFVIFRWSEASEGTCYASELQQGSYDLMSSCLIVYGDLYFDYIRGYYFLQPQEIRGNMTYNLGYREFGELTNIEGELNILEKYSDENVFPVLASVGSLRIKGYYDYTTSFSLPLTVKRDLYLEKVSRRSTIEIISTELNDLHIVGSYGSLKLDELKRVRNMVLKDLKDLPETLFPNLKKVDGNLVITNFEGTRLVLNIESVVGNIIIQDSPKLEKVLFPNLVYFGSLFIKDKRVIPIEGTLLLGGPSGLLAFFKQASLIRKLGISVGQS